MIAYIFGGVLLLMPLAVLSGVVQSPPSRGWRGFLETVSLYVGLSIFYVVGTAAIFLEAIS